MNVVVIPCFDRACFLSCTLDLITQADQAKDMVYLFAVDFGFDPEVLKVIDAFPFDKAVVQRSRTPYRDGKQSHNLLSAYSEACYLSDKYVFLIEDDIFISKDFFNYHLAVHEKHPNTFCSIGAENHNTHYETEPDDSLYYFGDVTDYQSWGVCWNKDVLEDFILPHANTTYYNNPMVYLQRVFNQDWIGRHFCEQDGLIRRVRYTKPDMPVIFPHNARCFHAGFYSYHRNTRNRLLGSLEEKKRRIMEIVTTPELYQQWCERPEYYNDSKAIDLYRDYNYNELTYKQAIRI